MRSLAVGVLSLMLMANAAQASDRPVAPPTPPVDALNAPAVPAKFARNFTFGEVNGHLGQTALGDVRALVGAGAVDNIQDLSWLCYDLPAAGQRVWLSSDGAGGRINTVTVSRIGAASSRCAAIGTKRQTLVIDGGVRLGMTKAELIALLGKPSREIESWVVYSARQSGGRQGLAVQFVDGRAAFVTVIYRR